MRAASSGQPFHRLARKLSPKSEVTAAQPGQSLPGTLGTVQSVNGDGTATVVFNGTPIPCQLLGDFVPVVGQGVLVLIEGTRNWCIGPASTAAQTWQLITATVGYASGWSDYTGGAGYVPGRFRLIGDVVELEGTLSGPGGTGTVFTLPSGYWPAYNMNFDAIDGGGGVMLVQPTGVVEYSGSRTVASLNDARFSIS